MATLTNATIATIRGQLHLTVADGEPIFLGSIEIPIEASPGINQTTGNLTLTAKPNMREVREAIEEIFGQAPGNAEVIEP